MVIRGNFYLLSWILQSFTKKTYNLLSGFIKYILKAKYVSDIFGYSFPANINNCFWIFLLVLTWQEEGQGTWADVLFLLQKYQWIFFYYWFGVHFCKNIHRYCWILVFLSTFYPLGECQGTWADVWLIHRYSLQHRNAIQEGAQWWCMSTIVASSQSQVNCVRIFFQL